MTKHSRWSDKLLPSMIEHFSTLIPDSMLDVSGKVFYSGPAAFNNTSRLYILGLNPGGYPEDHASETVRSHTTEVLKGSPEWSAYRDEGWRGLAAGTDPMQRRVLHLMRRLNMEPARVPASNLVFVRSARGLDIKSHLPELERSCWAFHLEVIEQLEVRVIVCFGGDASTFVRKKLNAVTKVGEFLEDNKRKWRSSAYLSPNGIRVLELAHPSRADWTEPATDPTPLVQMALAGSPVTS